MRWQPYPKYKPSGVEWLGEVPEGWDTWKITHGFRRIGSGTTPRSDNSEYYDGGIPWVTTSELRETVIFDTAAKVTDAALRDYPTLRLHPEGSLLFAMYGATIGRLGVLGIPATVNQACAALIDPIHLETWFTFYWLQMRRPILIVLSAGGGQPNLSQDDLRQIRIPAPSLDEQIAIADFLDRETGKIDTLVAKNRTLIERLKEKRSALISRTVTRGLPPDAARAAGLDPHPKLKPSGVEWLGEVPEGWEVRPIKFLVSTPVTDGPHETPEILDKGIPFVSAEAISGGQINFKRIRGYISEEDHRNFSRKYRPEMGDIYIVKSGATTGRVAMVLTNMEFNIWSPLAAIRCNPNSIERHFLYSYLQSKEFQTAIELSWSFGTQQNIGMGVIQNLVVPVPSLKEQTAIADFLDRETAKIDALVAKVEATIERLKEYRSVLITVAVTGKIDVRGVVAATDRGLS